MHNNQIEKYEFLKQCVYDDKYPFFSYFNFQHPGISIPYINVNNNQIEKSEFLKTKFYDDDYPTFRDFRILEFQLYKLIRVITKSEESEFLQKTKYLYDNEYPTF